MYRLSWDDSFGQAVVRFAFLPQRMLYTVLFSVLWCTLSARAEDPAGVGPVTVELNQGWSRFEIDQYHHATEGTNLAPLDFVLNLPDPVKPGSRFIDRLTSVYGFIADTSPENEFGLPVGFAVDSRPEAFGDRKYVGITCSACHTRQLTFSKADAAGKVSKWLLPVHGGPSLADFPKFEKEFYDTFFLLLTDGALVTQFSKGVLGRDPTADDIATLRAEIREVIGPVEMTRELLKDWKIPAANFGPGNLNALSQGNYNNEGLKVWIRKKGHVLPKDSEPRPKPRFEGTNNFPPMWFSPHDNWAQWFVEIHHPGNRNWVQSIATSSVRPPKMVAALKGRVILAPLHFENTTAIQRSLDALRTPKWPDQVFGTLDRELVKKGGELYKGKCSRCHARHLQLPNELGYEFKERLSYDVGTDPTAFTQFVDGAATRVRELTALSEKILEYRQAELIKKHGLEAAINVMNFDAKGQPNLFQIAKDMAPGDTSGKKSGAAYWAPPLEGVFATSPYLHNGSVRTLSDLLTPPDARPKKFRTGTMEFDAQGIGLKDEGSFEYDTSETGKGNDGHWYGTDLLPADKKALLEYLKSL